MLARQLADKIISAGAGGFGDLIRLFAGPLENTRPGFIVDRLRSALRLLGFCDALDLLRVGIDISGILDIIQLLLVISTRRPFDDLDDAELNGQAVDVLAWELPTLKVLAVALAQRGRIERQI